MWQTLIAPLILLIFVIVIIFLSNRDLKEIQKKKSKENSKVGTSLNTKDVSSPIDENLAVKSKYESEVIKPDIRNVLPVDEQSKPQNEMVKPAAVPVDSPLPLSTKPIPFTTLIDLSPETFRQGIILAEILGRPKTLRKK